MAKKESTRKTQKMKEIVIPADSVPEMSQEELRYLLDAYNRMQDQRKRLNNRVKAMERTDKARGRTPRAHVALKAFVEVLKKQEDNMKRTMETYALSHPVGQWAMSIRGVGAVTVTSLLAYINIYKVKTAGQIQSYCGLNPRKEWKKGHKRPFNARLKQACWNLGESFCKSCKHPESLYGHAYLWRKQYENEKNEAGEYAEKAAEQLRKFNYKETTEAYKAFSAGRLPKNYIHERCKRYAVKLFLSHFFDVWYETAHGMKPPLPYAMGLLSLKRQIPIPNYPLRDHIAEELKSIEAEMAADEQDVGE